ncbi:MAG: hypothetical protein HZC25_12330 [Rhodospirillales bacterium]|nr:hypothetical protein [Rhodospirillales bacterium]
MVGFLCLFRLPAFSRFGLALMLALAMAFGLAAGEAKAQAPDTKKPAPFPPYPDLWQRTIPMAEWVVDDSSLDVEMAEDGDVVIRFGGGGRTGWIKFFSGESFVTTDPAQQADKRKHYSQWGRSGRIEFPNGDSLNYITAALDEEDWYRGFFPHLTFFRKLSPEETRAQGMGVDRTWKKYWLAYLDKPRRPLHNSDYPGESFEEWVFALPFAMIRLEDGTLLAASPDLGEAFRLNPDMTSPAIDNRRLFLVDEDALDKVLHPIGRLTANLKPKHDAVRAYLDALRDHHERKKNF